MAPGAGTLPSHGMSQGTSTIQSRSRGHWLSLEGDAGTATAVGTIVEPRESRQWQGRNVRVPEAAVSSDGQM